MSPRELFTLTLKGLLAWLVLSGLVWYFGEWLAKGLFPLLKAVIMTMTSEMSPSLKLIPSTQALPDDTIELSSWVLHPLYINASVGIPPGTELKASAHLLHALVPLVIDGSILLVWPVQYWQERLVLLVFGLLTAVLVIMATLPAQLLGTLEISFQEVALSGNHPRSVPWFVDWMVFCEMGGCWLLAIFAAGWCIQLQRWLLQR
ncbi:MAG: hypothetical protein PHC94_09345 [Methylobacter sp.]|nr:hypothetical protein [Methylococcales bacterium]MDD5114209.1 hypothetical protein [Methylobacter sp.]